jgi:hypothetical protein
MLNYGEEIAYWYLRFNGFFPIDNFVIHPSEDVDYPSDVDIIAVRFPHVYEEIGGKKDDWDTSFLELFPRKVPIGLLCEVKTGNDINGIFKPENVSYAVGRFGFIPHNATHNYTELVSSVQKNAYTGRDNFQIVKVLFSKRDRLKKNDNFFHFPLSHLIKFLNDRFIKYPKEKYKERMYFSSNMIQYMIESNRYR